MHPDFVMLKLDCKNAHNSVTRAAVLRHMRASQCTSVRELARAFWATMSPLSRVWGIDCLSEEGVQQGDGLAGVAFAVAIQPHLESAAASLEPRSGIILSCSDDMYIHAPADVAFKEEVQNSARNGDPGAPGSPIHMSTLLYPPLTMKNHSLFSDLQLWFDVRK